MLEAFDKSAPRLLTTEFAAGVLWMDWANEYTKTGSVGLKDLHRRPKVLVWIVLVSHHLGSQEPSQQAESWAEENTIEVSIEQNSFNELQKKGFKYSWGLGKITFQDLKDEKPRDEHAANRSTS